MSSVSTFTRIAFCFLFSILASACVDLNPPWPAGSPWAGGHSGSTDSGAVGGTIGSGGGPGPSSGQDAALDVPITEDANLGEAAAAGGAGGLGGNAGTGGASNTNAGGTVSSGGGSAAGVDAAGGAVGSGGAVSVDGATSTGGTTSTGGVASTGGTNVVCGKTVSTFSELAKFSAGVSPLQASLPAGAQLASSTAGPSANASLCTGGCAVLTVPFTDGTAAYSAVAVSQVFSAPENLVGAAVVFTYAIDNPANIPIQMLVYAANDAWKWAAPSTIAGADLARYSAATGFAAHQLSPVDNSGGD